ncbi:MAG: NUDIX domain-containing protein [Firmicutes bacterium]|nr:NUDIX domain-containing protein [Bacillota bacterium]
MNNLIRIGVGALVQDDCNRILLVKHGYRSYWYDRWILPGGMLEPGETLVDCAKREVFEETGLEVVIGPHLITFERIVKTETGVILHVVYVDFWARAIGGILAPGDDVGEAMWAKVEELSKLWPAIHEDTQIILRAANLLPLMHGDRDGDR